MAAVRMAGRLIASGILFCLYVLGWAAGSLAVAVFASGAAVRLGWSDVRKRGEHGAA